MELYFLLDAEGCDNGDNNLTIYIYIVKSLCDYCSGFT